MAVMDLVGQRPLVIFSKSNCCICYSITQLFYGFGANPAIYELDQLQNGKQLERELVALGRQPSVPAVFIGGKLVGGSNEIMSLQVRDMNSPGPQEFPHQLPPDMEARDLIRPTDQLAAYEHHRYTWPTAQCHQLPLQLLPILKLVKLVNRRICTETIEKYLHAVAHATIALAEYHQGTLGPQIHHRVRVPGHRLMYIRVRDRKRRENVKGCFLLERRMYEILL
ncbi:hypothetical protein RHGRI_003027 [Rhododendron griersonianum]|uniref:Glutaredoxin domain-containing protein n=1 Tax=Rhododendron griersonianum TaxID=479676 RepID=A0AAV6LRS7_9ERIC|nr:hypothetical protein RHGRI_003027 [Rhododendron griersonianum]